MTHACQPISRRSKPHTVEHSLRRWCQQGGGKRVGRSRRSLAYRQTIGSADRERRQFVASCMGQDPDDADFDCDDAQQRLVDTSEVEEKTGKNGFEPEGEEYPCQLMHTRTNKTKERAAIDKNTRQPIIETYRVANDFFAPVS